MNTRYAKLGIALVAVVLLAGCTTIFDSGGPEPGTVTGDLSEEEFDELVNNMEEAEDGIEQVTIEERTLITVDGQTSETEATTHADFEQQEMVVQTTDQFTGQLTTIYIDDQWIYQPDQFSEENDWTKTPIDQAGQSVWEQQEDDVGSSFDLYSAGEVNVEDRGDVYFLTVEIPDDEFEEALLEVDDTINEQLLEEVTITDVAIEETVNKETYYTERAVVDMTLEEDGETVDMSVEIEQFNHNQPELVESSIPEEVVENAEEGTDGGI